MPGVYTEPTVARRPAVPAGVRAVPHRQLRPRLGRRLVRVPVPLPERPGARSRSSAARSTRASDPSPAPTGRPDPHGIPNLGKCIRCNLQIEGSGVGPRHRASTPGNVASGNGAPIDAEEGRDAQGRPRRRLRPQEPDGSPRGRARRLRARDRRLHPQGEQVLLRGRVRHAHVRLRPRRDAHLRRGGQRRLRRVPGRRARTPATPARDTTSTRRTASTSSSRTATRTTTTSATRARWATRRTSCDNNFYDNTTGIATDSFYAGGHPGYPQDSAVLREQPDLLEQLQRLRARLGREVLGAGPDRRRAC